MTGFAERSFSSRTLQAKVSIKSLNHRFFDWNYKGISIGDVENKFRAICQKKLHRGRVEVSLELSFPHPSSWEVRINEGLLERILSSLSRVSSRLGQEVNFSVENIFKIPQVVELKRKDFTQEEVAFLERSFLRTVENVVAVRREEGRKTGLQMKLHVQNIKKALGRIEKLARKQPGLLGEKLRQRLKELDVQNSLSEERLAEEVAFLAQRYDFTEEIVRLKSHLGSFLEILSSTREEPAGKKLDFITQELHREVNTMNAKSQDFEITKRGLIIKGELESIRQLVQNLE